jgi:hypothetical protein
MPVTSPSASLSEKAREMLVRKWHKLRSSFSQINVNDASWKYLMIESSLDQTVKEKLYNFREDLSTFLMTICIDVSIIKHKINSKTKTECKSYGSKKITSDIDVSVSGKDIISNKSAFHNVIQTLKDMFVKEANGNANANFNAICNVCHFFDMNFYLSDFGVLRDQDDSSMNQLSSYYLSSAYGQRTPHNQFNYAFEYAEHPCSDNDKNHKYQHYLVDLSEKLKSDADPNLIIDLISKISLYEDECYNTQGAFFHVVMIMQRKIEFMDIRAHKEIYTNMLIASYIENLVFASMHPDNYEKYLNRVNDAHLRLQAIRKKKGVFTSFNPKLSSVAVFKKIRAKLEALRELYADAGVHYGGC